MAGYENTSLWQSSLGKRLGNDQHFKERDFFRVNYESLREKARCLGGEINRTLPEYTVHDITHLDALWEMASLICGEDYKLNPAEAFVLGGAFLIHDLGMGIAAYPQGVNSLKDTVLWTDTFSHLKKRRAGTDSEIEKETLEIILRSLHAKHAEKLALASWGEGSNIEYLIDDPTLRDDYGVIIGKIAHSHWWDASELSHHFKARLGASGNMPNDWEVDPLKLACIMRVADASHIDSRRAPEFLRKLRNLSFYSEQHWKFQQRLYQPRGENEKLVYTAKSPFKIEDSMSWWLCFDALKMIDRELSLVDSILHSNNRQRLKAKGVSSIENIDAISKLITPDGWLPVDTKIHVGNITGLVKNLGGVQLYGDNPLVPLRELIQNACDAIRARRLLENEDNDFGKVIIRHGVDEKGVYFEVEDNGVGMSSTVLSGPFLDFGNSFWGSIEMHNEFPGLETKSYKSTGKFGVGFFSVFMWEGEVSVTTRRYEESRSDTKVLVFESGQIDRPLLRPAFDSEMIKDGGTRVRVYIKDNKLTDKIFNPKYNKSFSNVVELISSYFFTSDVSLYVEDEINQVKTKVIHADEWMTMDAEKFVKRITDYDNKLENEFEIDEDEFKNLLKHSKNISNIVYKDKILGRGFLSVYEGDTSQFEPITLGQISIGGYNSSSINGFVGCLIGKTNKASRDLAIPVVPAEVFKNWMKDQANLLKEQLSPTCQVELAGLLQTLKVDLSDLKFVRSQNGYLNKSELKDFLNTNNRIYLARSMDYLFEGERFGDSKIIMKDNVLSVGYGIQPLFDDWHSIDDDEWDSKGSYLSLTLYGELLETIANVWNVPVKYIYDLEYAANGHNEQVVVCQVGDVNYYEKVLVLDRDECIKNSK